MISLLRSVRTRSGAVSAGAETDRRLRALRGGGPRPSSGGVLCAAPGDGAPSSRAARYRPGLAGRGLRFGRRAPGRNRHPPGRRRLTADQHGRASQGPAVLCETIGSDGVEGGRRAGSAGEVSGQLTLVSVGQCRLQRATVR
jgi:hypothetical protein